MVNIQAMTLTNVSIFSLSKFMFLLFMSTKAIPPGFKRLPAEVLQQTSPVLIRQRFFRRPPPAQRYCSRQKSTPANSASWQG
jgi:hypothetical protein